MNSYAETFMELKVWQEAHKLVLLVYPLSNKFPKQEQFGLCSQIRRSAVSVPSNIVEGFHRRYNQESLRFYNIAEASLEELKYQMLLARDLIYISPEEYKVFFAKADMVGALLHGWMRSFKK